MKAFRSYTINEYEIRDMVKEYNNGVLRDQFDQTFFLDLVEQFKDSLDKPLREILMDCDVMLLSEPEDFRNLVEMFVENWSVASFLCPSLVEDYEANKEADFHVVFISDDGDSNITINKSDFMKYY